MLDIQKFQALPKDQQEALQNSIKFVYDVFGKEYGTELAKDYMLQYGVWGGDGEIPKPTTLTSIPVPPPIVSERPQPIAIVEKTKDIAEQDQKVYGEDWIVLQNRLLHAISSLELNERRLILFLSPIVRLGSMRRTKKNREIFTVSALDFAKKYDISPKSAYRTLALVATSILHKAFFYWNFDNNEKGNKVGVSWFVTCEYMEKLGHIELVLADEVVEMLTVFDKANPFTKYQKDMIAKLGTYGIVLFELIASCMYQKYKQKAFTIEYLREKFDCVDTYPKVADFKNRVLDKAIQEIHKYTPYQISYEQKKAGRIVTELVFTFEDTSTKDLEDKKKKGLGVERDPNTIDWVNGQTDKETKKAPSWQTKGLSDSQINKIKVNMKEFIDANTGKISPSDRRDYPEIFESWRPMLKDPKQVVTFHKVQELLDRQK